MQSPWEVDQRNKRHDTADNFKGFERSTSAPPPETSLLFGSRNEGNGNTRVDVSVVHLAGPVFLFASLVFKIANARDFINSSCIDMCCTRTIY